MNQPIAAGNLGFHGAAAWISFAVFVVVLVVLGLLFRAFRRRRKPK